jgi:hypothetical protein
MKQIPTKTVPSENPKCDFLFKFSKLCEINVLTLLINCKKLNRIFFLISIFAFFQSCKEQIPVYSSDPAINEFVRLKKAELSEISLEKLLTYNLDMQRAIFASWTPEKKKEIWLYKLCKVFESGCYNADEILHIQKLKDVVESNSFSTIQQANAISFTFQTEWLEQARNDLHWTEQFIAFLVYRLWITREQFDAEMADQLTDTGNDPVNCNCNTTDDFCRNSLCISVGCIVTESGCGWLWSESCNGRCTK